MGLSMYSLWTLWGAGALAASGSTGSVFASKYLGAFASGSLGLILAWIINGWTHIAQYLTDAVYGRGDYATYTFAIGFCAFIAVMVYNIITTKGRTAVQG
jgi:hypothetical protein